MIIGITGYARHGKDTVAQRLVDAWGYTRIGLADQVRVAALALDPIVECVDLPAHAHRKLRLSELVDEGGWETAKGLPEVRRTLQRLGTEVGRGLLGEDIWIQMLERAIPKPLRARVVVPDVRFPNEAEWVMRHGMIIKVVRPHFDNGVDHTHESEAHIDELPYQALVMNDGTVEELWERVDAVMRELLS